MEVSGGAPDQASHTNSKIKPQDQQVAAPTTPKCGEYHKTSTYSIHLIQTEKHVLFYKLNLSVITQVG